MEEDKLKKIFMDFNPELSPDTQFLSQLQHNLDTIELVKQQYSIQKKQNKKAIIIATIAGFSAGILFTWLTLSLEDSLRSILLSANLDKYGFKLSLLQFMIWILSAGISIVTALNTYEIVSSVKRPLKSNP